MADAELQNALATAPGSVERRGAPRHAVDGAAHLVGQDGRVMGVRLINLSATGALVTRPQRAQLFAGSDVRVAGASMPWERTAHVVAVTPDLVRLRFH